MTNSIEVINLSKKYKDKEAVANINFKINENEMVGLLGPNGCGKTTTIGMILGLLKPSSGEVLINGENIEKRFFPIIQQGIDIVCQNLAKNIARDGEGANCLLEVMVQGAKNTADAIMLAKSICNSALVKTAIHGCDPNWGRIISAAGNSGVQFNLNDVDLYIGNDQILEKGKLNKYDPQKVTDYIKSRMKGRYLVDDIVKIMINLNSGESKGTAWGCDLSKKYVEINSEYTT